MRDGTLKHLVSQMPPNQRWLKAEQGSRASRRQTTQNEQACKEAGHGATGGGTGLLGEVGGLGSARGPGQRPHPCTALAGLLPPWGGSAHQEPRGVIVCTQFGALSRRFAVGNLSVHA